MELQIGNNNYKITGANLDDLKDMIDEIGLELFTVHYSDNGYSDTLHKAIDNKTDAIKWLDMWYSDLSGGA